MFYDAIARYYEAENQAFTDDLGLYTDLAAEYGGPVLEVGSGTGRVLFHLAQAGYEVLGVDVSAPMLAVAERKLKTLPHLQNKIRLVQADILSYQDSQKYPLILLSYNALMHFPEADQQVHLLQTLGALLSPGGAIVIDLPNAGEAYAAEDIGGIVLERVFVEPVSGNLVMQQSVSQINRAEQRLKVTWIYDEIGPDRGVKRHLEGLELRYIFPAELGLLLQLSGLAALEWYGDYEQGPFVDGCNRMIVVAGAADV
jgi:SAM-dependent methyltransferase